MNAHSELAEKASLYKIKLTSIFCIWGDGKAGSYRIVCGKLLQKFITL